MRMRCGGNSFDTSIFLRRNAYGTCGNQQSTTVTIIHTHSIISNHTLCCSIVAAAFASVKRMHAPMSDPSSLGGSATSRNMRYTHTKSRTCSVHARQEPRQRKVARREVQQVGETLPRLGGEVEQEELELRLVDRSNEHLLARSQALGVSTQNVTDLNALSSRPRQRAASLRVGAQIGQLDVKFGDGGGGALLPQTLDFALQHKLSLSLLHHSHPAATTHTAALSR
jgi:hypothetical protein